jgi:hypothetical protein
VRSLSGLLIGLALASGGCGGPTADLTRARQAYDQGDLYRTLALLRIVGEDEASLSIEGRAQHAYLRGMTDHRIAATLPADRAEERVIFRGCARRWLERARSLAPGPSPTGLGPEQLALVAQTLTELGDAPESDCDRTVGR